MLPIPEHEDYKQPRWYVGVKYHGSYTHCDIFKSLAVPTFESHGKLYAFCWGGYKTRKKAIEIAMYHNYAIDTPQPVHL